MLFAKCDDLYRQLSDELDKIKAKVNGPLQQTELSFQVVNWYYLKVVEISAQYRFPTIEEEIHFYRNVRPMFTSELNYYRMLYHAQLFMYAEKDPVRIQEFWSRESLRLEKFIQENLPFYQYFQSGRTDQDKTYFTLHHQPDKCVDTTKFDPLVSQLLSLQRYHAYVICQSRLVH